LVSKKEEIKEEIKKDMYTEDVLKSQYILHKEYIKCRNDAKEKFDIKFRLAAIPEDISENSIKFIIQNIYGDKTSS